MLVQLHDQHGISHSAVESEIQRTKQALITSIASSFEQFKSEMNSQFNAAKAKITIANIYFQLRQYMHDSQWDIQCQTQGRFDESKSDASEPDSSQFAQRIKRDLISSAASSLEDLELEIISRIKAARIVISNFELS
jgi:hypothetical protein